MFGSADENAGRIADQDLGLDGDIAAPAKLVDLKPRPNSGEGLRFTVCVNHPLDDRECAQCGSSSPRKRVTELQGRAPLLVVDVRRTDDVDRRRRLQGVWDDGDRTGRAVHQPLEHRARQRKSHCSARRRAEDEQTGVRGAGGLVKETRCVCAYQLAVVDPDVARRQLTLHIAEQVGVENEALVQGAALRQPCGLASGSGGPLGNPGAGRGVAGVVVLARPSGRASPSSSGPPHVLIADLATTRSASRGRPPGTRPSCSTRASATRASFAEGAAIGRSVVFVTGADDLVAERLTCPRAALTAAEYLAFERGVHVLLVLVDMTNSARRCARPPRRGTRYQHGAAVPATCTPISPRSSNVRGASTGAVAP